jgi:hypothetical protein
MAKKQMVNIRYLGKSLLRGQPKREFIDVGGQRFWNCRRFPEQNDDLSYTRPLEFYEEHKAILGNPRLFIVDIVTSTGEVKERVNTPYVPTTVELAPELAEKGVVEVEGMFLCPACDFSIAALGDANGRMKIHMVEHE